jgi:urea transport system substrate-binding protein
MKFNAIRRIAVALLAACPLAGAFAADPIKVGSIFDLTGGLNVDDINAHGGLIGRQVEIVQADAQSELSKYPQYANTMVMRDHVSALFAALTSSAREAVRPVARRSNTLYFYSSLYEGGVCDGHTFITGPSASQQLSVLIKWAVQKYGKRIYVMAADYNFGTISASWVREYAHQLGAEVIGAEFLPLTVTDYSATVQKIEAAKPDFVFALPVGANQTGFMEQFAAAGLKKHIGIVSTNFGSGNQQIVVSPSATEGVVVSLPYFDTLDNAENKTFKSAWQRAYGDKEPIVEAAVDVWNAAHLWAAAVRKAGSVETSKVRAALESGMEMKAPNGAVQLIAKSHHLRQNMYIAQGNGQRGFDPVTTFKEVEPVYENDRCDLVKHPATSIQYTPSGT